MSDNVVYPQFQARDSLPQSKEEIADVITSARLEHIEMVYPDVVEDLLIKMHFSGFAVPSDGRTDKDLALVADGIRSLMMKIYNIEHPLQDVADKINLVEAEDDC
jgi:hypothetical protein